MGLDVFLSRNHSDYHINELITAEALWDEFVNEEVYTKFPFEQSEPEEHKQARDEYAQEVFDHPDAPWSGKLLKTGPRHWDVIKAGIENIEHNSPTHPDGLFNIGYFRSSYNSGGFNSVMERYNVPDLYVIFDVADHDYYVIPDWEASLERAQIARQKLLEVNTDYSVIEFHPINVHQEDAKHLPDESNVIDYYLKNRPVDHNNYLLYNKLLMTLPPNTKIVGIVHGQNVLGKPCQFLIIDKPLDKSYYDCMDVIVETCEYVINSGYPEQFYLRWSG